MRLKDLVARAGPAVMGGYHVTEQHKAAIATAKAGRREEAAVRAARVPGEAFAAVRRCLIRYPDMDWAEIAQSTGVDVTAVQAVAATLKR